MGTGLRLETRHYETIVAIIDQGSMTRAADQLSITQSAMSHRLAEAERRLGVAIFSRGVDRRLTPTHSGRVLYQAATRALAELRRAEEAVAGATTATEVSLRIGVGGYDAYHWFPGFIGFARSQRPEVELDLVVVGDHPSDALHRRIVDVVLTIGGPSGDLALVDLFDDELVLLCAPSHTLASRSSIEASDLIDETLFTYNALPSPGFEYHRFIGPSNSTPRLVRVVPQTAAIIELVAAGTGVSILSRWAIAEARRSGRVATSRCGGAGLPIRWRAATRPNDAMAAEIADLLAVYCQSSADFEVPGSGRD